MTTRSAPQQAERRHRRALLAVGDGRAKFAPPSPSGRSRRVLPIPRHRATRGFARQRVEHGACKLPEPSSLDGRAWRVVNGVADSAAPFGPSLPVTVGENFPHRATRRFTPTACGDGGANCAPPFESRSRAGQRGWRFSGPVGARCRIGTPVGSVTVWLVLAALPVDNSAYSTSHRVELLDVVVIRSYLTSMTTRQHTTTTEPPTPGDASEPFGARLARRSREAQGLLPVIADPRIRERLRGLCGLPKPPETSGVPDELDPAGQ